MNDLMDAVKELKNSGKINGFEMKRETFNELFQTAGGFFQDALYVLSVVNQKCESELLNLSFICFPDDIDDGHKKSFFFLFRILDCLYKVNFPSLKSFDLFYSKVSSKTGGFVFQTLVSIYDIRDFNSDFQYLNCYEILCVIEHLNIKVVFSEDICKQYCSKMFQEGESYFLQQGVPYIDWKYFDVAIHKLENFISRAKSEIDDMILNKMKEKWQNSYLEKNH